MGKKTITFGGDETNAIANDNGSGIDLNFWLVAGSNFTSGTLQPSWGSFITGNRAPGQVNLADSTSNEWYLTGCQLEVGSTASGFEFEPYASTLQKMPKVLLLNSKWRWNTRIPFRNFRWRNCRLPNCLC